MRSWGKQEKKVVRGGEGATQRRVQDKRLLSDSQAEKLLRKSKQTLLFLVEKSWGAVQWFPFVSDKSSFTEPVLRSQDADHFRVSAVWYISVWNAHLKNGQLVFVCESESLCASALQFALDTHEIWTNEYEIFNLLESFPGNVSMWIMHKRQLVNGVSVSKELTFSH